MWSSLVGHEQLIESFRAALRAGRLGHAYLFAGPQGVGKHRFAITLGQSLLCEGRDPAALEACGVCPACVQVAGGVHPDFFLVGRPEEKNELPIDVIQTLCRDLSLKPARGGYKIAVVDDADDLNQESANCFLKTLEEPPPHSLLILIGTQPELQLATILSRCQVVRFAPLAQAQVKQILLDRGLVEDPARADALARMSGGSVGRAQELADPALWDFRRELLDRLSSPQLDSVGLARQMASFAEGAGSDAPARRRRGRLLIQFCAELFRELLCHLTGQERAARDVDAQPAVERLGRGLLQSRSAATSQEVALSLLERALEADWQIDRYVQLSLVLECFTDEVAKLLAAPPPAPPDRRQTASLPRARS